MTPVSRRGFTRLIGTAAVVAALPAPAVLGQAKPRAVVIGGGAGGATAARYIAKDSKGAIEVTLIEPEKRFTTCFFSNLYLGGFRSFDSITHGYDKLAAQGVKVVHDRAAAIDRGRRVVRLAGGGEVPYDRLVCSPGIDLKWDSVAGYSEKAAETMPHAWKPGAQTQLLRRRLEALEDGQNIVMVAPPDPFRCPPGPYERVSMMAHYLKTNKPKSKVIVLDTKEKFSKQGLFMEGWEKHYPGMVEWLAPAMHGGVKRVDPAANTVTADLDTFKAGLANIIPAQMAGSIVRDAGLATANGFCPIVPATMQSRVDSNVHVIGDACVPGDMPKSGFSANSQAKVAALAVRVALSGARAFPARFANTCWSLIETDDCVKVGGKYEATDEKIKAVETFISQTKEDPALRKANYAESVGWYEGITADMFG